MKRLLSQKGMSLIEIMVAVSILSVISVSVIMLSKNMDKSVKSAELKADMEGVMREIVQIMTVKESCSATVAGAAATGNTFISSIKIMSNRNEVEPHPRLKVSSTTAPSPVGAGIIINGMYLKHIQDNPVGANYELRVTFIKSVKAAQGSAKVRDTFFGQIAETRKIPLQLDNCARYVAVGRQNGAGGPVDPSMVCTGSGGQTVGEVLTISSSSPTQPDEFRMVGCRVCSTRTTVKSCI